MGKNKKIYLYHIPIYISENVFSIHIYMWSRMVRAKHIYLQLKISLQSRPNSGKKT